MRCKSRRLIHIHRVMQIISLDLSFLDQKLVYEVSYTAFSTVIFARENNALSKVNAPEN